MIESRYEGLESVMSLKAVHVEISDEIDDAHGPSHELNDGEEITMLAYQWTTQFQIF